MRPIGDQGEPLRPPARRIGRVLQLSRSQRCRCGPDHDGPEGAFLSGGRENFGEAGGEFGEGGVFGHGGRRVRWIETTYHPWRFEKLAERNDPLSICGRRVNGG